MSRQPARKNGKRLASPQSANSAVKATCDIMRRSNCAGALQYVPELTWILFLRILDERETREAEEAEAVGAEFRPSLAQPFRWRDWAAPGGGKRVELENGAMGALFGFVNEKLLPRLKELESRPGATARQKVIGEIMSGVELTRIDTEKNFLDVIDKVHEISSEAVGPTHVCRICARDLNLCLRSWSNLRNRNSDSHLLESPSGRGFILASGAVCSPQGTHRDV